MNERGVCAIAATTTTTTTTTLCAFHFCALFLGERGGEINAFGVVRCFVLAVSFLFRLLACSASCPII